MGHCVRDELRARADVAENAERQDRSRDESAHQPLMTGTRGLVCAGGEATRLGELTRVANKHLLPIGRWPMIYYPLQLLQRAGVREVLIVTGKAHAGQMIDLLGD